MASGQTPTRRQWHLQMSRPKLDDIQFLEEKSNENLKKQPTIFGFTQVHVSGVSRFNIF